jgi:mannosyltransferase
VKAERMDLSLIRQRLLPRPPAPELARRADPAIVAFFATAVSAAGAAHPSFWIDEAATISASANRSLTELWRLLGNSDLVHGLYNFLMHGWFALFPATEFWSRLPSCLAVGAAAAGVVILGKQLSTRLVALCAGVVFAILPRVTWAAIEARPYALTMAVAVWLSVLLVVAVRTSRPVLWPLYGLGLVAATVLNIMVVLLVLPHAVVVAVLADKRSTVKWWAGSSVAAILVVAPFLARVSDQKGQISWISSKSGWLTVPGIVVSQYFDFNVVFALLAIVVLAAGARRVWRGLAPSDIGIRPVAIISVAWIALPTVVLLVYSVFLQPIYYPRYLCYTSPAMALLLGVCIAAVARTRGRVIAVLAVFALAATPYNLFYWFSPYGKGMDYSKVADIVTKRAAPGDCLIIDDTITWSHEEIRAMTAARPAAYAKLVDPARGARAADRNSLWDEHVPIWTVADRVRQCTVLWTVSDRDSTLPDHSSGPALDPGPRLSRAPAYQVPQQLGFHIVERWQFKWAQVAMSTRSSE